MTLTITSKELSDVPEFGLKWKEFIIANDYIFQIYNTQYDFDPTFNCSSYRVFFVVDFKSLEKIL